jgi:hypothetical protein
MTRPRIPLSARAEELLLLRALYGLDVKESAELAELGADADDSFDLAAAAVDLLAADHVEQPMPAGLFERIIETATSPAAVVDRPLPPISVRPKRRQFSGQLGFYAAAACLCVAIFALIYARRPVPVPAPRIVYVQPPPAPAETASQARNRLLRDSGDAIVLPWKATADAAARGASGDVVWSASAQRGYMRFVSVAPNDARRIQYQLWIFDKARDARYPVDGGVFDVSSSGEVIVPITARLKVEKPVLFAVTVERAGGVVVSKRERILVTAAPKAG